MSGRSVYLVRQRRKLAGLSFADGNWGPSRRPDQVGSRREQEYDTLCRRLRCLQKTGASSKPPRFRLRSRLDTDCRKATAKRPSNKSFSPRHGANPTNGNVGNLFTANSWRCNPAARVRAGCVQPQRLSLCGTGDMGAKPTAKNSGSLTLGLRGAGRN